MKFMVDWAPRLASPFVNEPFPGFLFFAALLGLLGVVLCAFGVLTVLYFQDLITMVIHSVSYTFRIRL
jgi:hypothetical protein